MKTNPRIRYFCPEYLLHFIDDIQSESDSEGPDEEPYVLDEIQRPIGGVIEEPKLDYEIEHIRNEPAEKLGFDLFSYFRRKSTDRPRSALSYLQVSF